ncbi:hypothetical protein MHYP_G00264340 [Metynnis hypsauchen]
MTTVCTRCLDDVIYENMSLTIHGHVKPNAKVFTIDVMKDNDIFFHFKPCFGNDGRHMIKRNSLIGREWGPEEADTPHFPFARGKSFVVKIVCTNEEFKVDVNGSHLLNFRCRQPDITKINKVIIFQDVITMSVRVEPCGNTPQSDMLGKTEHPAGGCGLLAEVQPCTPHLNHKRSMYLK